MRFPPILALAIAVGSLPSPAVAADNGAGTAYARRLTGLVNDYRASRGLPALAVDPLLDDLAREHSAAMAKAGALSHDEFPSRVRRSGHAMCVENVGWNYPTPEKQLEGWRNSPGHDANMLDARVSSVGTGFAGNYVTLIACASR